MFGTALRQSIWAKLGGEQHDERTPILGAVSVSKPAAVQAPPWTLLTIPVYLYTGLLAARTVTTVDVELSSLGLTNLNQGAASWRKLVRVWGTRIVSFFPHICFASAVGLMVIRLLARRGRYYSRSAVAIAFAPILDILVVWILVAMDLLVEELL